MNPKQISVNNVDIDKLDRQILAILMVDANKPYTDIAKQLYVSGGTVHVRMRKLEQMGIVQGASLTINHAKLGYDICAFLGIHLDKNSLYDEVIEKLKQIPEIVDAHYTTGLYSIFAKIYCRDTEHLRQVLHYKIQRIPGIQRTETFISLESSISRPLNVVEDDDENNGEIKE
jgi:Lrp/AsnC family transcriptional regulator for asnA, asnC and gidA